MPLPLMSRTTRRVSLDDVGPLRRFEHRSRVGNGLSRVQPIGSAEFGDDLVAACGFAPFIGAGAAALASNCLSALLVGRPPGVQRVRSFSFPSAIASA